MTFHTRALKVVPALWLAILLTLNFCSKEDVKILPTEKMPVTTNSQAALADYHQGLVYGDKLQRSKAIEHFKSAVEKDPAFASAWLNLALNMTSPVQLMANLDSAVAYSSTVSEAERLVIQAVQFQVEGNYIKQSASLKKAVSLYPGDERLHNLMGNHYFGLQQYQQAIKSYSRSITLNENLAAPYNMLGYAQRSLGNYGEAEKAFKRYIKLNPENPNAFDSYAELLLEMGRYNESNEFYRQALDLDSLFASSYLGIATNYDFLGEFEKARQELQVLKEIAPNYMVTRQALRAEAVSYVCEGDLMKALDFIEEAMQLAADHNDVANVANDLLNIGDGYVELGEPQTAFQYYEKAQVTVRESDLQQLVIENFLGNMDYNIAMATAANGQYAKAREIAAEFLKRAIAQKNPVQVGTAHQLNGIIALYEKQYQEAIDEFDQANQLNPYNLYRMGVAYDGLGDHEQATLMMRRARELNVLNNYDQAIVLSKTRGVELS